MPTLRTGDAEVHYEVMGQGPTLLLLHGLGSWGEDWAPQMRAFAPAYRVVTMDARGHGRSPRGDVASYSIARFAADAAAVLQAVGGGPAHVVGLSMGGMIAFQLAVDHPALLRTLAIVNSGPAVVPTTPAERKMLATRERMARWLGPGIVARMIAPRLFPRPEHGDRRWAFRARMRANDRRAYLAATRAIIGWSVLDRLGEIDVPVLVVSADADYTPVAAKEAYVKLLRRGELVVVPDSRHALPIECPERFNTVLDAFLARHA